MASAPQSPLPKALQIPDYDASDFTCYEKNDLWPVPSQSALVSRNELVSIGKQGQARVLFASCFCAKYVSRTVRRVSKNKGMIKLPRPIKKRFPLSDYAPSPDRDGFLNSISEVSDTLFETMFYGGKSLGPLKSKEAGLLLICGATNVAKSKMAKAIIHRYITESIPIGGRRKPHLVTLEDPIEGYFQPRPNHQSQVDYTPRQVGIDVPDIPTGVEDALRQTPSVLFIGEVRNTKLLPLLLNFGGSGHLVVTTFHAGNLPECMDKLLRAAKATTPAQRSFVARSLKGIIHLRPVKSDDQREGILPSVWRKTPSGEMALVSDGVSSVLPQRDDSAYSLGRSWFARKLKMGTDLEKAALDWDYKGE